MVSPFHAGDHKTARNRQGNIRGCNTLPTNYQILFNLHPEYSIIFTINTNCGNVCYYIAFLDVTSSYFPPLVPCLKITLRSVTDVSLDLKDSDTELENLSSLIRFSVSDSQKTDSLKDVSFIGIK